MQRLTRLIIIFFIVLPFMLVGCDTDDYELLQRRNAAAPADGGRLATSGTFNADEYRRFSITTDTAPVSLLLDARSGRSWYRRLDSLQWLPIRIAEPDTNRFEYSPLYDLPPADTTWEGIDHYDNVATRFAIVEEFELGAALLDRKWGRTWYLSEVNGYYWWIPIPMERRGEGYFYSPIQTIE